MSSICRFTVPASRDLESIIDLIADNQGLDAAENYLKKINQKCQTLVSFPNMGRKRDELFPMVRSFPLTLHGINPRGF
jgi:toxin ParE1/3/4